MWTTEDAGWSTVYLSGDLFQCAECNAVGRIVEIDTDCDEFTDEEWQAFEERM